MPNLDVHAIQPSEFENLWMVYERLLSFDDKLQPVAQLADTWDVGTDCKRIRLTLRKGVQWHSGREFTSDDVKYNLLRVRDRTVGAGTFAAQSMWFTNIDTPDKNTVVLTSDQPRPLVYDFLANFNMVDKATLEAGM
ncbi:MAG: hypothetical protein JO352_16080 [Chloroflexi bacterium]|nr:hypothetical protein [Chloroflexota bacterium]MBV9600263.1 hypothetical protein [Chloroflexota bacterium]